MLDRGCASPLIGANQIAQIFGIETAGQGCRVDQVAKQKSDLPALRFGRLKVGQGKVTLRVRFSAVLRGRTATEVITALSELCQSGTCVPVNGHVRTRTVRLRDHAVTLALPLPLRGHGFQVELRTNAFQSHAAQWGAAHATVTFIRHP